MRSTPRPRQFRWLLQPLVATPSQPAPSAAPLLLPPSAPWRCCGSHLPLLLTLPPSSRPPPAATLWISQRTGPLIPLLSWGLRGYHRQMEQVWQNWGVVFPLPPPGRVSLVRPLGGWLEGAQLGHDPSHTNPLPQPAQSQHAFPSPEGPSGWWTCCQT